MRSDSSQVSSASGLKVAIIVSLYHHEVTSKLAECAQNTFIEAGGDIEDCQCISVPGAWELPVVAKNLAAKGDLDAIVALGCIITGETTHDKVIANAIAQGLMQVSLEWKHPVSMGVLTCQNLQQALARAGGSCGNKGAESMQAALATIEVLRKQA